MKALFNTTTSKWKKLDVSLLLASSRVCVAKTQVLQEKVIMKPGLKLL